MVSQLHWNGKVNFSQCTRRRGRVGNHQQLLPVVWLRVDGPINDKRARVGGVAAEKKWRKTQSNTAATRRRLQVIQVLLKHDGKLCGRRAKYKTHKKKNQRARRTGTAGRIWMPGSDAFLPPQGPVVKPHSGAAATTRKPTTAKRKKKRKKKMSQWSKRVTQMKKRIAQNRRGLPEMQARDSANNKIYAKRNANTLCTRIIHHVIGWYTLNGLQRVSKAIFFFWFYVEHAHVCVDSSDNKRQNNSNGNHLKRCGLARKTRALEKN